MPRLSPTRPSYEASSGVCPRRRIIYSAHYYFPHEFTHTGGTRIAGTMLADAREKIRVPYLLKVSTRHREPDILQKPPMNILKQQGVEWNRK
jgi:hypothetical protein